MRRLLPFVVLLMPFALRAQQPPDSLGPVVDLGKPIRVQFGNDTVAGTYHAGRVVGVGSCRAVRLDEGNPDPLGSFDALMFRGVIRAEVPAAPGAAADSAWVAVTPTRLAELTNCDPTGARVVP